MKINKFKFLSSVIIILILTIAIIYNIKNKTGSYNTGNPAKTPEVLAATENKNAPVEDSHKTNIKTEDNEDYNIINPSGNTLETRINTPKGYKRITARKKSLAGFLRNYKMKKDGKPVLLYNGSQKGNQSAHIAVFKLPIENEDLQQCADSVMRVYAEYFWHTGQKDRIKFHFVDGFLAEYSKWRKGARIQVTASGTSWTNSATEDNSYKTFKKYLRMVFAYSSTLSMEAESKKIKLGKLRTGDIFIKGGSPGHVVMVADVCKNQNGKKAFLLAQGYMPAQEFHVLKNPAHKDDPWYYEEETSYPLITPEYTFNKGSLKRLDY
ncbi:MAG: DUF4846 domain-containing protein [Lachnospiraceae bacterium]